MENRALWIYDHTGKNMGNRCTLSLEKSIIDCMYGFGGAIVRNAFQGWKNSWFDQNGIFWISDRIIRSFPVPLLYVASSFFSRKNINPFLWRNGVFPFKSLRWRCPSLTLFFSQLLRSKNNNFGSWIFFKRRKLILRIQHHAMYPFLHKFFMLDKLLCMGVDMVNFKWIETKSNTCFCVLFDVKSRGESIQ